MSRLLLSPNATALEKTIADLIDRRLNLAVDTRKIWDPDDCPVELLPWLAWTMSIDTWLDEWPEAIKRQVIKDSILIHQHKGTLAAVRRALAATGVTVDVIEWWQQDPPGIPHTFRIRMLLNSNWGNSSKGLLSKELYQKLRRAVEEVKPLRSQFDVQFGAGFNTTLDLVSATRFTSMVHFAGKAQPIQIDPSFTGLRMAGWLRGHAILRLSHAERVKITKQLTTPFRFGAALGYQNVWRDGLSPQAVQPDPIHASLSVAGIGRQADFSCWSLQVAAPKPDPMHTGLQFASLANTAAFLRGFAEPIVAEAYPAAMTIPVTGIIQPLLLLRLSGKAQRPLAFGADLTATGIQHGFALAHWSNLPESLSIACTAKPALAALFTIQPLTYFKEQPQPVEPELGITGLHYSALGQGQLLQRWLFKL